MPRTFWAALAAVSFAITTGCAMCDSCFDYAYPAAGGKHCWQADDCCRAGSAFCDMVPGDLFEPSQVVHGVDEIHDPVPDAPSRMLPPTPSQEPPQLPRQDGAQPPADLGPPVEVPDTGAPGFDDLDLPRLDELE